jgi:2'-5' RNA ligase
VSTVRLFVAVDLDDAVRRRIGRIAGVLKRDAGPGLKATWVRADRAHVTLHFIGDVGEEVVDRLVTRLGLDVDVPSFEIAIAGLGVFPSPERPRVIWIGVRGGAEMARLHDAVSHRLENVGLTVDARPHTPHVTLARLRGHMTGAATRALASHAQAAAGRCRVDAVTLYRSEPGQGGAVYTPLARACLRETDRDDGRQEESQA